MHDDSYELDGEAEAETNELGEVRPGYLSPHFRATEFACNHCHQLPANGMHPKLIEVLEQVREHFHKPVVINSGYRCPTHNHNVGGATRSQHLRGTAADIRVRGVAPSEVYEFLSNLRGSLGGLGSYRTFTHIDVGPDGRRWRG